MLWIKAVVVPKQAIEKKLDIDYRTLKILVFPSNTSIYLFQE